MEFGEIVKYFVYHKHLFLFTIDYSKMAVFIFSNMGKKLRWYICGERYWYSEMACTHA